LEQKKKMELKRKRQQTRKEGGRKVKKTTAKGPQKKDAHTLRGARKKKPHSSMVHTTERKGGHNRKKPLVSTTPFSSVALEDGVPGIRNKPVGKKGWSAGRKGVGKKNAGGRRNKE